MIDLYTWTTPNGRKVSILLEELGIEYRVHAIDISKGNQFSAEFLQIAPNNRIPAIVDHETGVQLMESAAIMLYLADKYKRFHCTGTEHWRMMEWLMWQMAGLGPMLGQAHHFLHYNPGISEYAEQRYAKEAARLYGVLNTWDRPTISCIIIREYLNMQNSGTPKRPRACMACSIRAFRGGIIWRGRVGAPIPLPTWRYGPGYHAFNGSRLS